MLMATINQSIVLIALPDVFHGIGLNPLAGPPVSTRLSADDLASRADDSLLSGVAHAGVGATARSRALGFQRSGCYGSGP
jgi:hypothetical protein